MKNRKCTQLEAEVLRGIRLWTNGYLPCPGTATHEVICRLLEKGWVKARNGRVYHFLNTPKGEA